MCTAALLAIVTSVALLPAPAHAAPSKPQFGPGIEGYAPYEGQSTCSPEPKPGVVAFQAMVLDAYPWTRPGNISRSCSVGGQSEHKEGRAWDWGVEASVPAEKAAAEDLFDWLFAEDRYGNADAMARRLGIMYIIFNRKSLWPGRGWGVYCTQTEDGCIGSNGTVRDPHTNHVHFSFGWYGAYHRTTFWNPGRSMIADISSRMTSSGYWLTSGNGEVFTGGTSWFGSLSSDWLNKPIVTMASTPSGDGYWLVNRAGTVSAFGGASRHGSVSGTTRIVDMAVTPTGNGYWLASRGGRVYAFGDADEHGSAQDEGSRIAGIAATPSGRGYWLFARGGRVFPYGNASRLGGARGEGATIVGGDNFGSTGYWLVSDRGQVFAFSDAPELGDLSDTSLSSPVVGIAASPSGNGYYLVTSKGNVYSFGDA